MRLKAILFLGFMVVALISTSAHAFGGVSGGGGNVISPTPPDKEQDPEAVETTVRQSTRHLKSFLEQKRLDLGKPSTHPIFSRLFSGCLDILSVIQSTHAHIEDEGPCYDSKQNPVDGSVVNVHANHICISAFTIAQKVHENEIPAQALALLLHEYSEVMGFSEDEAYQVQKLTLTELESPNKWGSL